jgi:hypothetical protein
MVGLFHSAFNMTNGQKPTPELLLLPEELASLIPAVAVMVPAVLLVVFTRGRLVYEPDNAARPAPSLPRLNPQPNFRENIPWASC